MDQDSGRKVSLPNRRKSVTLIRYADDFVIIHESLTVVQRCQEVISEWLKDMGLELKPSKTRLIHTLQENEGHKPGFDFLGFNIRQFKAGKYTSGKDSQKRILGFSTIITPSKESQKEHYTKITEVIDKHKAKPQAALIKNLNSIIRGWCNYFSIGCPTKVFYRMDYLLYWKLRRWAIELTPQQRRTLD
ncbi:group II intron maturase-specific domain-containing protein [Okeania sp. SIO2B3]|uniref:group II intron maturase-specific domain-containing protein n=1 Tax=Okeania sp. SIO2B3 TaxID=2607784 RepID=UPI0034427D8E